MAQENDISNTVFNQRAVGFGDSTFLSGVDTLRSFNPDGIENPEFSLLNRNWISSAFMTRGDTLQTAGGVNSLQFTTSASLKFTDTRPGGNIGINPRPQFCQYSDVPVEGRFIREEAGIEDFSGNYGLGRQYSEMIDDPARRIYMSFGVPEFNSIIGFLRAAYEGNQITLARTGRGSSIVYNLFKKITGIAMLVTFPQIAIPFATIRMLDFYLSKPRSKFYTFKPTMHVYWGTVNTLCQAMAANRGIIPSGYGGESSKAQAIGQPFVLDEDYLRAIMYYIPDFFREASIDGNLFFGNNDGNVFFFDVYSMATRGTRIANAIIYDEFNALKQGEDAQTFNAYAQRDLTNVDNRKTSITDARGNITFGAEAASLFSLQEYKYRFNRFLLKGLDVVDTIEGLFEKELYQFRTDFFDHSPPGKPEEQATGSSGVNYKKKEGIDKMAKVGGDISLEGFAANFDAQMRDGHLYTCFIVDETGSKSESWSNSETSSELANTINAKVNQLAEARFSIMDGNIIGGAVGAIAGTLVQTVTNAIEGVASSATFGISDVLRGLGSGGFLDVPKHWNDSSFSGMQSSYTIQLFSPYGNPFSIFTNIDIPVAMLMAGCLPRSVGKSSYTAPFICQLFDRGRCQFRLAMVKSLSLTRGTSHLSFTDLGKVNAVDVSFDVIDLSSIMHMSLSGGDIFSIGETADTTTDEDSILSDYLAVLAGMDLYSQIYAVPKARLKAAKVAMNRGKLLSGAYWASVVGNSPVYDVLSLFTRQSAALDYTGSSI